MKSFNFLQQVLNDETAKRTNNANGGKVKGKEIGCVHFFGVAYPNTPARTAKRTER